MLDSERKLTQGGENLGPPQVVEPTQFKPDHTLLLPCTNYQGKACFLSQFQLKTREVGTF